MLGLSVVRGFGLGFLSLSAIAPEKGIKIVTQTIINALKTLRFFRT
jgi:hypothetical protein